MRRPAAFAVLVATAWAGGIALAYAHGIEPSGLWHQPYALCAFVAATVFVLQGVARLRGAVDAAIRAELERAFLARFVPPGTDLQRFDGRGRSEVQLRHASLLAVDIRGFSELSRRHPGPDVLRWLLQVRGAVNAAVTSEGGIVDKFVGDAVLAQSFEGDARRQARDALPAALAVKSHLNDLNRERLNAGIPEIRLVTALMPAA